MDDARQDREDIEAARAALAEGRASVPLADLRRELDARQEHARLRAQYLAEIVAEEKDVLDALGGLNR